MPAQDYWEAFFDVGRILDAFNVDAQIDNAIELGCGYGTFTLPLAQRTGGQVYSYDIDAEMVDITRHRAEASGISNLNVKQRDIFGQGFDLPDSGGDICLLFNILHGENPVAMLREAARVVRPGGTVAVIHWRSDIATPRGPSLNIRPSPEQILAWAEESGWFTSGSIPFLLPPWHYGIRLTRH